MAHHRDPIGEGESRHGRHRAGTAQDPPPVLSVRGISHWFGGLQALRNVDLDLYPAEILAIVGDNGAGKSTLLKILAGNMKPTSGEVRVGGEVVSFDKPASATQAGIATVYQDLALALDLSTAENMFLGRERAVRDVPRRWLGHLDRRGMETETRAALDRVHVRIPDISTPCANLSGGQRQAVAIARAITWCDRVLLLDEPTAALGVEQQREVLDLITHTRDTLGVSVIFVSHQLPHVLEVADRIAVLRRGSVSQVLRGNAATAEKLVAAITGLDSDGETV